MEKFYRSKSGEYTGTIVGTGAAKQCILDKKSQAKLARVNIVLAGKQR